LGHAQANPQAFNALIGKQTLKVLLRALGNVDHVYSG
jgi:hypothetical protein